MKKITALWTALALILGLCACAASQPESREEEPSREPSQGPTWQEQYDLGVRYLSEGNYREAIIAFTAAIEIDPRRAPAYVGRGDAYVLSGETQENLAAAQADYETAIELDETIPEAYLGLADVYIRQGDYEKAQEILREGLEKTGNSQLIADKLAEMDAGSYTDSRGNVRRSNQYSAEGELLTYAEYHYDASGRLSSWEIYSIFEGSVQQTDRGEATYNEKDQPVLYQFYDADGNPTRHDSFVYNEAGQRIEQHRYESTGEEFCYFLFYYDEQGREIKYEGYWANGEMYNYWISEYDENGVMTGRTMYDPDGTIAGYELHE